MIAFGLTVAGAVAIHKLWPTSRMRAPAVPSSPPDTALVAIDARNHGFAIDVPGTIQIDGASFEMGSHPDEIEAAIAMCHDVDRESVADCERDREIYMREQPRHVTLSAFNLDAREVTVAEFVAWLDTRPRSTPPRAYPGVQLGATYAVANGWSDRPIAGVSWREALRYCEDHGGALPTEAQWELAARGVGRRAFPWGDRPPRDCDGVIFAREPNHRCAANHDAQSAPVGTAPDDVTPEGVHDLGGNVSEWTLDAATVRPTCQTACVDPVATGAPTDKHVVRGGNWFGNTTWLRSAGRSEVRGDDAHDNIGFRCVQTRGTKR